MWDQKYIKELENRNAVRDAAGGEARVARQHEQGKMTARERVEYLFDKGTFVEIGAFQQSEAAYLPEKNYLPAWMTPKSAIKYMADFYENFNKEKAYSMLKAFDLPENQKIKTMSKGMQEKVQLLLVMSREAKLYILDEPLGGVDPVARDFIMETIMKNRFENSSILLSTHLIYDIEGILDRVLMIKGGELEVDTDVKNVIDHNMTVEDLFKEVFRNVF